MGEGNGTPLQYSCLENPMEGGAWKAAVHGVAEGRTQLSDFTFTFPFHALEKEMATHSSVLAWRIPGMGEPGGLSSMGSHRVGHDWSNLAAAAAAAAIPNVDEDVQKHSFIAGGHFRRQFGSFLQNQAYSYHVIQQLCSLVFTQVNGKLTSTEKLAQE